MRSFTDHDRADAVFAIPRSQVVSPSFSTALAAQQRLVAVPCPLCGSNTAGTYCHAPSHYGPEAYRIARCGCGMIFTNPQPVGDSYDAEVEGRGAQAYHLKPELVRRHQRTARLVLEELRVRTSEQNVLDFGCGTGAFVVEARRAGWSAIGIDLNRGLVDASLAYWATQDEHPALLPVSLDAFARQGRRFACVTAIQVFEHMQDPVGIGKQLSDLLMPGGLFYIDVPNVQQPGEWFSRGTTLDPTAHWNHFSVETLSRLMEQVGCDVEFASGGPSLQGLHQKHGIKPLTMARWTRRVLPRWTGSGVCVIGRKPWEPIDR